MFTELSEGWIAYFRGFALKIVVCVWFTGVSLVD